MVKVFVCQSKSSDHGHLGVEEIYKDLRHVQTLFTGRYGLHYSDMLVEATCIFFYNGLCPYLALDFLQCFTLYFVDVSPSCGG